MILTSAERATQDDSDSALINHATGIYLLKKAQSLAREKGHDLRRAFNTERINKALKHITAMKKAKHPTQEYTNSKSKILLFIAGLALSGYGIYRFFFKKRLYPVPPRTLQHLNAHERLNLLDSFR